MKILLTNYNTNIFFQLSLITYILLKPVYRDDRIFHMYLKKIQVHHELHNEIQYL